MQIVIVYLTMSSLEVDCNISTAYYLSSLGNDVHWLLSTICITIEDWLEHFVILGQDKIIIQLSEGTWAACGYFTAFTAKFFQNNVGW